jgi:hypothetical protein
MKRNCGLFQFINYKNNISAFFKQKKKKKKKKKTIHQTDSETKQYLRCDNVAVASPESCTLGGIRRQYLDQSQTKQMRTTTQEREVNNDAGREDDLQSAVEQQQRALLVAQQRRYCYAQPAKKNPSH